MIYFIICSFIARYEFICKLGQCLSIIYNLVLFLTNAIKTNPS